MDLSHRLAAYLVLLTVAMSSAGEAQMANAQTGEAQPPDAPQPKVVQGSDADRVTLRGAPMNLLRDQLAIWTSPAHIRAHDLGLLIPLGLATTVVMTTDHQVMSSSKLNNTSLNNHATTASNGLVGGFIVAPLALFGMGRLRHNDHATEAGILAGEAMLDSLGVNEVAKAVSERERPTVDGARGKFFQSGVGLDSSFPSNHSILAWSSATVIASEYPGILTQMTAYGLATGVSLTRVLGKEHFPSDVVVGSAVGWLIGRYVYRRHHKRDIGY